MKVQGAFAFITVLLLASSSATAQASQASFEILENGAGKFAIDIPGCQVASNNVESITIEDLVIDLREMTTGADWDYRTYGPGDAHYGSITIRSRTLPGIPSCLADWATTCSGGTELRKDITVTILKSDGSNGRTYNFFECYPTSYAAPPDPGAPGAVETIVVQPLGFSCDADLPDEPVVDRAAVLNGFAVGLGPSTTGSPGGVDPIWEFAQGGAVQKEKKALPFVDPTDDTQARLKGARSVSEVILSGPMTPSRKAMCEWINGTVQGQSPRITVSISEIKATGRERTYNYYDGFPVRYVFPSMSAGGTGGLHEEMELKPVRVEVK